MKVFEEYGFAAYKADDDETEAEKMQNNQKITYKRGRMSAPFCAYRGS